jgi:hypothetical protein
MRTDASPFRDGRNGATAQVFVSSMDGQSGAPSRRARAIEESILDVGGVALVRVWELPARVEIGIVVAPFDAATDVLRRVSDVVEALRSPDEEWDVGLLND